MNVIKPYDPDKLERCEACGTLLEGGVPVDEREFAEARAVWKEQTHELAVQMGEQWGEYSRQLAEILGKSFTITAWSEAQPTAIGARSRRSTSP